MAITFPTNPTLNQSYTSGNTKFVWDGSVWRSQRPVPVASQANFDINTLPTSPHAMDDEFNDGSLNIVKWRTSSGGDPTGWTLRESCATATSIGGAPSLIFQSIADSSWKIRVALCIPQWFTGTSQTLGFNMYRTANQRSIDFGHWSDGSNNRSLVGNNFSGNYTAWNGTFYSGSYGTDAGIVVYKMNYWEFESNGTSVTWRWSNTGYEKAWRTLHTQNFSTWLGGTPDRVGFWLSGLPVGLIDWFRRIS